MKVWLVAVDFDHAIVGVFFNEQNAKDFVERKGIDSGFEYTIKMHETGDNPPGCVCTKGEK